MTRGGHQFNEHYPELKGFSAFYDAEILPMLEAQETKRLLRLAQSRRVAFWAGVVTLIVLALLYVFKAHFMLYIATFLLGVGAAKGRSPISLDYIKFQTKTKILNGICGFVGWSYQRSFAVSLHLDRFRDLGLLTSKFDFERISDRVTGEIRGAGFESFHLGLEWRQEGDQRASKPSFEGRIIIVEFERSSLGKTVVLRDKGAFNPKVRGDMKRVGLVDPVFEKIFEAYSTDQVEARYLLTPDFMQRLVDLENVVEGENIRFGFADKNLLIAIETENKFDVGDMTKSVTETARTQKILDEIGAIYNVVDGVMKR